MARMLESDESARRLGVKVTTLYAYVSRGLLVSHPAASGRRSLFDMDEVERLSRRSRQGKSVETRMATVTTGITQLTDEGPIYRGRRATELATEATYEEVAELLWSGFGDPEGRVLIVGLAPAAHGGNRTGRVFTGDRSGDFLWTALHETGFADRGSSRRADDGLTLTDTYIAAAVRCAPPLNRPTNAERDNCAPFLVRELAILANVRVIVPLGGFGWDAVLRTVAALGHPTPRPKPRFGHGAEVEIGPYHLVASFHPSQQNTFTGRLTAPMLASVMRQAATLAGGRDRPTLMGA